MKTKKQTQFVPNPALAERTLRASATADVDAESQTTAVVSDDESEQIARSLVERIGGGDSQAEAELVERYRRGLFFVLRRECGDAELAQDITQDALTRVILNARDGRINRPVALSWYIRQTGVYQLIDYKRKQKRRRTSPSTDIVVEAASDDADIADSLDAADMAGFVRQILEEMPIERDRELLRRFYLVGQDKALIAAEFDISSAHFDRVKYRALQRLRQLMDKHLQEQGTEAGDWL